MIDPVITAAAILRGPNWETFTDAPLPWASVAEAPGVQVARIELRLREHWPGAPDRIGRMDRASVHQLLIAHRIVTAMNLTATERESMGVVLGTSLGCAEANEAFHRGLVREGAAGASAMLFAQTVPSAPVGLVGIAFGIRGHAVTVMAGRCSAVAALAEARRAVRLGRCARVLVLAGDVVGPDRVPLLGLAGTLRPAEAAVGVLVEDPVAARTAGRRPIATLTGIEIHQGAVEGSKVPADDAPDWLGASGLVELACWLHGLAPDFAVEVADPGGLRGRITARREHARSAD